MNVVAMLPTSDILFLRCVMAAIFAAACCLLLIRDTRPLPWRWLLAFACLLGLSRYLLMAEAAYGAHLWLTVPELLAKMGAFGALLLGVRGELGLSKRMSYLVIAGIYAILLVSPARGAGEACAEALAALAFFRASRREKHQGTALEALAFAFLAAAGIAALRWGITFASGPEAFRLPAGETFFTPGLAALDLLSSVFLALAAWNGYLRAPLAEQDCRPRTPLRTLAISLLVVTLAAAGLTASSRAAHERDAGLRRLLLLRVQTAALALDSRLMDAARLEGPSSPQYSELVRRLGAVAGANEDVRFLYLLHNVDGVLRFVAEAPTADPADASPPGSEFPEAPIAFFEVLSTGEPRMIGPAVDRWGTWMTGAAPVWDRDHKAIIAALGMDIPAKQWWDTVNLERLRPLTLSLLLVLLVVGGEIVLILRRAAQERIARSEKSYRALFGHMPLGHARCRLLYDTTGRAADWEYLEVNAAFETHSGMPATDFLGRRASETPPGFLEAGPRWLGLFERVARNGETLSIDEYLPVSGRWLTISAYMPEPGDFALTFEDISELRRAWNALQESESRTKAIFDTAADGIIVIDEAGIVQRVNAAICRLFGYDASELLGQSVCKLMPEPHASQHDQYIRRYLDTNEPHVVGSSRELEARRKDGTLFPIELSLGESRTDERRVFTGIVRDITSRRQAEEAVAAANAQKEAVLQAASEVSIISTDREGVITVFNTGAEHMLGYRAEEVLGQKTPVLIHLPSEIEAHSRELSEELGENIQGFDVFVARARRGGAEAREWTYVRKDGSHITVSLAVTAVRNAAGEVAGYLGVAVDITARKLSEAELLRQRQLLNAVVNSAAMLISAPEYERCIVDAFRQVAEATDLDRVYVFENHDDPDTGAHRASLRFEYAIPEVPARIGNPRMQNLAWDQIFPHWYPALAEGRTIRGIARDFRPSERRRLDLQQTVSIVVAPVIVEGRFWGILGFDECHFERVWSKTEVAILELYASIIGGIISRQHAERTVRESNALLHAVHEIQTEFIAETDPNLLFERLLHEMLTFTQSRRGFIARARRTLGGRTYLQVFAVRGGQEPLPDDEIDLEPEGTLGGQLLKTATPLLRGQIDSDVRTGLPGFEGPFESFLGLPLLRGRIAVGMIVLTDRPDGYDRALIERLGPLTASCANILEAHHIEVERRRAVEAVERQREWLAVTLSSIGDAVIATDTQARITFLNPVAEQLTGWKLEECLGAPLGEVFHIISADSRAQAPSPVAEALTNRRIVELADNTLLIARDGRETPIDDSAAPIQDNQGRLHGAVLVFRDVAERKRHEAQIAEAREQEVEIGARIQQTLLLGQPPTDMPKVEIGVLTVPSQGIDGDFYDFFRRGDDHLSVVVGDVMGKGIPAALMGAATRSAFHQAMGERLMADPDEAIPRPEEVVNAMHRIVTPRLMELESFVTLCHIRFDLLRGVADVVDCGHTKTLHCRIGTGECRLLEGSNLPLGVLEREVYEQRRTYFREADVFFLYSDGLTDMLRNDERFGQEALTELVRRNAALPPHELIEAIWSAAVAFSGNTVFIDDLTCVAVRLGPRSEAPRHLANAILESDLNCLADVRAFVREACAAAEFGSGALELELAANEAFTNIVLHGYEGTGGRIELCAEALDETLILRMYHWGRAFYDGLVPPPVLDASRSGGFGLHIIRESVDAVSYLRSSGGRNCVKLAKRRV